MKRGLLIDYYYCTGCKSCEVACAIENGIPVGQFGIKVEQVGPWEYEPDKWQLSYIPVPTEQCNLCEQRVEVGKQPSCVHNCQADAMRYGTVAELVEYMGDNTRQVLFVPETDKDAEDVVRTFGQPVKEVKRENPAVTEKETEKEGNAMGLSMESTIGDVIDAGAVSELFEKHFPGLLADPNLQNGAMLKFGTFVQFPQAAEKGISEETLSAFFTEANAL